MKLYIDNLNVWYPHCEQFKTAAQACARELQDFTWPKLGFVPAMQRRRLSPFAKMALYVANETLGAEQQALPVVFSSRHGDIHKTSGLLNDLAQEQALSPTAFALSVHNAIPGLYSILTKNKQAINAIAAGKDSFFMALLDAYARLTAGVCQQVLVIHADQDLPRVYDNFVDEQQIPHALALIVSLAPVSESASLVDLSFSASEGTDETFAALPGALTFADWMVSAETEFFFCSGRNRWQGEKNV